MGAACGGVATTAPKHQPGSTTSTTLGGTYSNHPWYGARYTGRPNEVEVTFDAPSAADGASCAETRHPYMTPDAQKIVLEIREYLPFADKSCPMHPTAATATLPEALGSRLLVDQWTQRSMRDANGKLELVVSSLPCGRADCSTPSPTPAPCTSDAYRAAIDVIDGHDNGWTNQRCDGSFLILDMTTGGQPCPSQEGGRPNPCARPQRAYYVARDGAWKLVTYAGSLPCSEVTTRDHITYPAALCS